MKDLKTPEQLKEFIELHGGVATLPMEAVRDAFGWDRLGKNVVANISAQLDSMGLAHDPLSLPTYQHQRTRIYKRGSQVGELIEAVKAVDPDLDEVIRQAATQEATLKLVRIRQVLDGTDESKRRDGRAGDQDD